MVSYPNVELLVQPRKRQPSDYQAGVRTFPDASEVLLTIWCAYYQLPNSGHTRTPYNLIGTYAIN